MPAAEQELPHLLQRFEHEQAALSICCVSNAMTKNRSVLTKSMNASRER
jgi:hypothetical protein